MKSKRRKQVFVLVIPRFEDISNAFYAGEIIKGVSFAASRLTTDILVHIVDRGDHRGWLDSTLLDRQYIDGIIFADIDNDVRTMTKAIRAGIPCMVLNNYLNEPVNCIAIDNKQATLDIMDHLIDLGHKKIATICGDLSTRAGILRLKGYKEGLEKHRVKINKSYITNGDFLRTPARQAAEKLLRLKNRPTAIFAASDVMALEVMDIAKKEKILVPQELSVVGFDNNPLCIQSSVGLSTVSQPLVEMGRLGAENLSQVVKGKARLPIKIMLPAKLIKRQSTTSLN